MLGVVVLHVELSVPGPQPAVGVVGVDGDGVEAVGHVELSVPGPQLTTGCCAFAVAANIVNYYNRLL